MSEKNYLITGHGSREYAFAKRLKEEGQGVYVASRKANSQLFEMADGAEAVREYDRETIRALCSRFNVESILATDETAIFRGIADGAFSDLRVLAPKANWHCVEKDKEAFKEIVRGISPDLVVKSRHCKDFGDFEESCEEYKEAFVLKAAPPSKDIVIFRDGISNRMNEIMELFAKHPDGLVIEEYIDAPEFSIHVMFNENSIWFSRAIKDCPFFLEGGLGPKTGGMGSVTVDLEDREYTSAQSIITRVLSDLSSKFGPTKGLFSFQFFKSSRGLLLNEVDIHPGDPESIVLISTLQSSLHRALQSALNDQEIILESNGLSAVATVFSAPGYPSPNPDVCNFTLNSQIVPATDAEVYFANCHSLGNNRMQTGSSRTLAIAATGDSISDCLIKKRDLYDFFRQQLYARGDIGSNM